MGCAISPNLFDSAFEVILRGARQVVRGIKLPSGKRFPPLRSYIDDITSIPQTAPCTTRLFKHFDELLKWPRMKNKAEKSRPRLIRKGVAHIRIIFVAGGELIPLLDKKPLRSLGRQYNTV